MFIISNGFDNNISKNSAKANSLLRVHASSTGELSPNSHAWFANALSLAVNTPPKNKSAGVFKFPDPSTGTGQVKELFDIRLFQNDTVVYVAPQTESKFAGFCDNFIAFQGSIKGLSVP